MRLSIIVPTYNNIKYLKFFLSSLTKNSKYEHELVIHINNGSDGTVDYKEMNLTRYTDWMITTPLMLWVLCLVFVYNTKSTFKLQSFLIILVLNFGMLLSGYFGEIGILENRNVANIIGFAFFAALYGFIYMKYLYKKDNFDNKMIFYAFLILWAFYGVFYQMDEKIRNIGYNVLDLLSKCFVGIFFWAYFTKSLVLK